MSKSTIKIIGVGAAVPIIFAWAIHLWSPTLSWEDYFRIVAPVVAGWLVLYGITMTYLAFERRRRFDVGLAQGRVIEDNQKRKAALRDKALDTFAKFNQSLYLAIHLGIQETYDVPKVEAELVIAGNAGGELSALGDSSFVLLWEEYIQAAKYTHGRVKEILSDEFEAPPKKRIKDVYWQEETGFKLGRLKEAIDTKISTLRG